MPDPKKTPSLNLAQLALATVTEKDGVFGTATFATGHPVEMAYTRNTEKSIDFGETYGQDIEPTGVYMIHLEFAPGRAPSKWTEGTVAFKKPLVLEATTGERLYTQEGWKARLHRATGLKKRALAEYLLGLGYDGIVTVQTTRGERGTGEIVALRA